VEALDNAIGLWGLFVGAFVSATLAPGGSEAMLAYLAAKSAHSSSVLLFVATSGNTLGAVTTWCLGYFTARGFAPTGRWQRGERKAFASVRRFGAPALLFSWLPVVGDALCFAAGWLGLRFFDSLVMIATGKALRYAAILYAFR
jgi:membrane protein YqaA with SNARE-associated domain